MKARASDHDDGETDMKARSLNLTDHYAFRTPGDSSSMTLVMYVNPRSLPGTDYALSPNARYEFHVSRAASKTAAPTAANDVVFRFEATGAPDASGVQPIEFTVIKGGNEVGTHDGESTSFAASKSNNVTANDASFGSETFKYFVGQRQDSFHFDVIRFFQARAFLASRFFGGSNGNGNASAALADNCRGDKFLANLLDGGVAANEAGGVSDGDVINLFNPPSCAPDFTKNYNVTSITLNVPIASLRTSSETVFDTWSTISVLK
ncbi:MAG: DUF4331 family protein [Clostridia bacterium]|nr:DUF4331 family protein [Deltaproteobacteria bacterium]